MALESSMWLLPTENTTTLCCKVVTTVIVLATWVSAVEESPGTRAWSMKAGLLL